MFRAVFDRDGRTEFDMNVGNTDINQGTTDMYFETNETAVIYDGSEFTDLLWYQYNWIEGKVAGRMTAGVTE